MEEEEETISKAAHLKRLAAKQSKIDELTAQLAEVNKANADLQSQVKTLNPEKLERRNAKLMQERDDAKQALADLQTKHATERAMLTAGITDPEDQELVNWRYGRLDEAKRPELGKWLEDGAKEDRHLSHLFKAEPQQEEAPRRGLPSVNGRTKQQGGPPTAGTLEALLAMPAAERLKPENRALFDQALADN